MEVGFSTAPVGMPPRHATSLAGRRSQRGVVVTATCPKRELPATLSTVSTSGADHLADSVDPIWAGGLSYPHNNITEKNARAHQPDAS